MSKFEIPEWPEVVALRSTYGALAELVVDLELADAFGAARTLAEEEALAAEIEQADREADRVVELLNVLAGPGERERRGELFAALGDAVGLTTLNELMPDHLAAIIP